MISNYTTLAIKHMEGEGTRPGAHSKGLVELGENMRGFHSGYAVSVTSGSDDTCEGSEEGKTVTKVGNKEDVEGCESDAGIAGVVGGIIKRTEVRIS
jgi:hypothetical protein